METTLDRFGRIVIPKRMREELGLHPGMLLQINQDDRKISIEPVYEESRFVVKKGVLVYQGTAIGNIEKMVKNHREERLNKIALGIGK